MKTLITHINPHLDDIAAIWLFKKFYPDYQKALVKFISAPNKPIKEKEGEVYFGVGRGKFDEHKGDVKECATSLVWKEVKTAGLAPKDQFELQAFDELVEWNRLIDTASLPIPQFVEFSVPEFIRSLTGKYEDSLATVRLGEKILDRIWQVLKRKQQTKKDWQSHLELTSRWGKVAALQSDVATRTLVGSLGGERFGLFLIFRPHNHSVEFFSLKKDLDLTALYLKVSQIDPKASWYLHQSKRMLLCTAKSSPKGTSTKLIFEQLIELAKSP